MADFIAVVAFATERSRWKSTLSLSSFATFSSFAFALVTAFGSVICAFLSSFTFAFDHGQ